MNYQILVNKKSCYYSSKGLKNGSYTRIVNKNEPMTDYGVYALQSYNNYICEDYKEIVLKYCIEPKTAKQIRKPINFKSRNYVSDNRLKSLITDKKISNGFLLN